ncbi:MAG: DUF4177 domain-containing protein [Pseudobutyrivibrio sp.]|nr:DUF4177 domain-containing protein [Pseudobutyrivibrio sp.]
MKQYKTVAGPTNINVGKGETQYAFNIFAEIINSEATDGWEYHSMETISVTEMRDQGPGRIEYYMLIFVKDM